MGVTEVLARYASRRAHVLVAEVPGNWALRALVERRLLSRGWCPALSPADADVLAVCGVPGPEFAEKLDVIWDQIPGPRVRTEIGDDRSVDSALTRAAAELLDTERHRRDATRRSQSAHRRQGGCSGSSGPHEGHGDAHDDMDHGGHEHMDHSGHQHMDHGEMEMAPDGIALAQGGDDRDGLEMDVLHSRLGPVLVHWPSGLVLECSLHGDVVGDAQAWVVDADHDGDRATALLNAAPLAAARRCDHIVDLLALAGWPSAADDARAIRDLLLDEPFSVDHARPLVEKLLRRLRRSWWLRWSLRDLAPLSAADLERSRLPTALAGDTYDRLLAHAETALALLSKQLPPHSFRAESANVIGAVPVLVRGLDVATARLVVASLGIDITPANVGNHG